MARSLFSLAVSLLALLLATVAAGQVGDSDGDSVGDDQDNCVFKANLDQCDIDMDGYGNACDADYNQDLSAGGHDFSTFRTWFGSPATGLPEMAVDQNCDGVIGGPDFTTFTLLFASPPGPSGLLCAGLVPCGGGMGIVEPSPVPGRRAYQERSHVSIAGTEVNTADGNLLVGRTDLSIDTPLGEWELGQVYNSSSNRWTWNFDIRLDGAQLIDDSGSVHSVGGLGSGDIIPGSHWVYLGPGSVRSAGGRLYSFDAAGQLEAAYLAGRPYPRLEYVRSQLAGENRVVEVQQCSDADTCWALFSFTRDAAGRVTSAVDRAGRTTAYAYDAGGRLQAARDGLDMARGWPGFRYAYSSSGRLSEIVNSEGERTTIETGGHGQVIDIGRGSGAEQLWRFSYSLAAAGTSTLVANPVSGIRRFEHDTSGRLIALTNEHGEQTSYAWSGLDLSAETLPSGVSTQWSYPTADSMVTHLASGNIVVTTFAGNAVDPAAPNARPILSISDSMGAVETRFYDGFGRLAWIQNGEGERTSFTYTLDGYLGSITAPNGITQGYSGHAPTHGHPSVLHLHAATADYAYDAVGNLIEGPATSTPASPGRPGVESVAFDEDRNVIRIRRGDGDDATGDVLLTYRSDGRLLTAERPYGGATVHVYDGLGQLVAMREKVDGVWETTSFDHNPAGERTATELPNGMRQTVEFAEGNRPIRYAALRGGIEEQSLSLRYEDGLLVEMTDSSHPALEGLEYDAAGRLMRRIFPGGETEEIGYDLRSRVTERLLRSETGAEVAALAYAFDVANRVVGLDVDGAEEIRSQYVDGVIDRISYGNGLERSFVWDSSSGSPSRIETVDSTSESLEYTYFTYLDPPDSSQAIIADTQTMGSVVGRTRETYWLAPAEVTASSNVLGTLLIGSKLSTQQGEGAWDPILERGYEVDLLGNWVGDFLADPPTQSIYNAERNRLLASPAHSYTYDEAGYVTARDGEAFSWTATGQIAGIGVRSFEWDLQDRLVSMTDGGTQTRYLFGGRVTADASGTPLRLNLRSLSVGLQTGEKRYRHSDFRGNVKFVTDELGDTVTHYGYTGYALERVIGTDEAGASFESATRLGDSLHILGKRVYDGSAGRFVSPDPVFSAVNAYTYAEGNPVFFDDSSGLMSVRQDFKETLAEALIEAGTKLMEVGILSGSLIHIGAGLIMFLLGMWLSS